MALKIGFTAEFGGETSGIEYALQKDCAAPRSSVVQVHFPARNMTLAYYNDKFDLHCGDIVYVDGKLEGLRGHVVDVSYSFKIKLSDYKRVIAVADTQVKGQFFSAGSHFVTFDREALPGGKAITWFKAPAKEGDEFVSGYDDATFMLNKLSGMKVTPAVAERGHEYYIESRVKYLSLDGARGYAIVEGGSIYEVEFEYHDGEIGKLTCSCFCSDNCKHEVAAMMQLEETLSLIEESYSDEYSHGGYFAAVEKGTLFSFAIGSKGTGSFTL